MESKVEVHSVVVEEFSDTDDNNEVELVLRTSERRDSIVSADPKWKYLLCGFFINTILCSPVYLFGFLMEFQEHHVGSLMPPILMNGIYLICTPIFFGIDSFLHQFNNRSVIVSGIMLTSVGVFLAGFISISSLSIIIYGVFGGIGTCITMSKVWSVLSINFPIQEVVIINAAYSTGQSLCQFIFPYMIADFRITYGSRLAMIIMSAFILHTLPLSLILAQNRKSAKRHSITYRQKDDRYSDLPAFSKEIDYHLPIPKYTSNEESNNIAERTWHNPAGEIYTQHIYSEEVHMKRISPEGVEIMQIIPEEDETSSFTSSEPSIRSSIEVTYEQINRKIELSRGQRTSQTARVHKLWQSARYRYNQVADCLHEHVLNPLCGALCIVKFYPAVLLKSSEIFSYVNCITVLPVLAQSQYHLTSNEVPFLVSLMAFPWLAFAISSAWTGKNIRRHRKELHILGSVIKLFGLLFIFLSFSKPLLTIAVIFVGMGQGISFLIQDECIKSEFDFREWANVQACIYTVSGLMIIIFGMISGVTLMVNGLAHCISFSACVYSAGVVLWFFIPFVIKMIKE